MGEKQRMKGGKKREKTKQKNKTEKVEREFGEERKKKKKKNRCDPKV